MFSALRTVPLPWRWSSAFIYRITTSPKPGDFANTQARHIISFRDA